MQIYRKYFSPAIGTKGSYELIAPFKSTPGELLECIAVRSLDSFIANNEDPLNDIYLAAGLTEQDYERDLVEKVEITTLRNDGGFTFDVPSSHIHSYPTQDGVWYRSLALNVFLPAIPMDQSLDNVTTNIQDVVRGLLGVQSQVVVVETSRPQQIDLETDTAERTRRALDINEGGSLLVQREKLIKRINDLNSQIAALEAVLMAK